MNHQKRSKRGKRFLWSVLAMAMLWLGVITFRTGSPPDIRIRPELPGIGKRTAVEVQFEEPRRGLGRLRVELVQKDRVNLLAEAQHKPRPAWKFWAPAIETDVLVVEVGSETIIGLEAGDAVIRASAWPAETWLRHPSPTVEELVLPVRLIPPSLEVHSKQHYVAPGGSGVVVYRAGESAVRDGVTVGTWWFPGHPLPGDSQGLRFALFGVPFDLSNATEVRLVAEDEVENRAILPFLDQLLDQAFGADTIDLSDRFMERVVPAIMAATPDFEDQGDLLQNYLWINGELRRRNGETLAGLGAESHPEFLWNETFMAMPGGQVMSSFADRRTYRYQGKVVDHQDHLGFDLASVRHADVRAANSGNVVLARYFGIYGNAVVIDHGLGLMSLYGHLSSLAVVEGQSLERGDLLGRSGQTGLAGGDHLHFTTLIRGHPVNPLEWWDAAWIRQRFAAKLQGAFPPPS